MHTDPYLNGAIAYFAESSSPHQATPELVEALAANYSFRATVDATIAWARRNPNHGTQVIALEGASWPPSAS